MESTIARRHAVRLAALPLISERGFENVDFSDVARACGLTEADLSTMFSDTRQIVTQNDYFAVIVKSFRESPSELSCAAAWVVAIDEIAETMTAEEWAAERLRNELYAREDEVIGGIVNELMGIILELNAAVAERCGISAQSTPVAVFSGTVIGTMMTMPLGLYPDRCSWVEAHAVAIETLGPSLDRLLQSSVIPAP